MTKIDDFRNLNEQELQEKEEGLKKELFGLNMQRKSGRVDKPGLYKVIRHDIARILTVLSERKNDGKKNK